MMSTFPAVVVDWLKIEDGSLSLAHYICNVYALVSRVTMCILTNICGFVNVIL